MGSKFLIVGGGTVYSTEEKVVGQWINNKPLYQKAISFTMPTVSGGASTNKDISISSLNAEYCNVVGGYIYENTNNYYYPLNECWVTTTSETSVTYFVRAYPRNTDIRISTNSPNMSQKSGYVIVQYTKTTD